MIMQCPVCLTSFTRTPSKIARSKSGLFFCTSDCKNKALKMAMSGEEQFSALIPSHYYNLPPHCVQCGKVCRASANRFCSTACSVTHSKDRRIQAWTDGTWDGSTSFGNLSCTVRKFLLGRASYKCSLCGWGEVNRHSDTIPLEINHIDGNRKNNYPENLEVLCPNCHSLTSTHRALNRQ